MPECDPKEVPPVVKLAPEAKHWRKLWSVQLNLAAAGLAGVGGILSVFGGLQWVQDHPIAFCFIVAWVNMAAVGARLIDQSYLVGDDRVHLDE